jgi:hypothetical protein
VLSLSKTIVAVSISTIRRAEARIVACESCDRTADTPFARILDHLGGRAPGVQYLMPEAARCPACGAAVLEHNLIESI